MFNIEQLLAGPRAYGADPFCLQQADVDDDGSMEWIGLREVYDADSVGGVSGFVLDGDDFYPLGVETDIPSGLVVGDRLRCDVRVVDANGDGTSDIAIAGQSNADLHTLALFTWNAEIGNYRLLGSFGGVAGVELNDEDRDGALDVTTWNCAGPGVALREVSRWENAGYLFSRSYYAAASDCQGDFSPETAKLALIVYYVSLDQRDLESAYQFLSATAQERQPYKDFVLSIAAVRRYYLGEFTEVSQDGEDVIVRAPLVTERVAGNAITRTQFAGEWHLRQTDAGWRIDQTLLSAQ